MRNTTHLQTCICLPCDRLDDNFKHVIETMIRKRWKGFCQERIGYVVDTLDNTCQILSQKIIDHGIWQLCIRFQAHTLLPEIGYQVEAVVHLITSFGIFLHYQEYVRIIIPEYLLEGKWTFQKQFSHQVYRNMRDPSKVIGLHDTLLIKMIDIRFERNDFSCIAQLVDPPPPLKNEIF